MTAQNPSRTLYVSDLDQTLLGADGTLGKASIALLSDVIDGGGLFTYATARSPGSARAATAGLPINLPVITYGGTVTAHPVTGAASDIRYLDSDVVRSTLRVVPSHSSIEPLFFTHEADRDWIRWRPERATRGSEAFVASRAGDRRLRPITDADPLDVERVHYVSIIAQQNELTAFRDAIRVPLRSAAHFLSADHSTPGLHWLEFHHPTGTKAEAIRRLMPEIGADRLIVFGDSHNDVPMFELAHESFAVRNAVPELAAIASSVIGHHDEDSVARFIADDFWGLRQAVARQQTNA